MRKLLSVVCLLSGLLPSVAMAAEPDTEQGLALLQQGKYAEAYALLEPFEIDKAGDINFDYLLGTAALNSGNPTKATFIFERILAQNPNYVSVRLDMGRAYYEMHDYARAKIEFETVIVFQNLPPDLKSAAEQYLTAMNQMHEASKTAFTAYIEGGLGHNANINSGISQSQNPVYLPSYGILYFMNQTNLKTSDRYLNTTAGMEVNHQASDTVSLYGGVDASARTYDKYNTSNYGSVSARGGVSLREGSWIFRTGINGANNTLHSAHSYDTTGIDGDARYQVNASNQVNVTLQGMRLRFADPLLQVQNYNQSSLTAGWMMALGNGGTAMTFSATGGSERAFGRDDGNKTYQGLRIGWQSTITPTTGAFMSLGAQRSKYDKINPTFLVNRSDKLYDLSLGVSWAFAHAWSLRPQVVYVRNDSNVLFNKYSGTDFSLNLRRSF